MTRPPVDAHSPILGVATCMLASRHASVIQARDHTTVTLQGWGVPELRDDVELVVSELVTNALRHGIGLDDDEPRRPPVDNEEPDGSEAIQLRLIRRSTYVLCLVTDPNEQIPVRREPDFIELSGRGLHLVQSCSRSWGCSRNRAGGKVVWALFSAEPAPAAVAMA